MLARQPHEEVLTLPNLIAWLEKQPADGKYSYDNPYACLLAQFMRANGFPEAHFGGFEYAVTGGGDSIPHSIPNGLNKIALSLPRTFGGALQKAYAAL